MTAKPDGMPEVVKALVPWLDRFMAKVEVQPDGCHLWTAAKTNKGYGKLTIDGRTVSAHRASWFIATGEWPSLCILHRCDTPACVNHAHHKLGTVQDNNQDMIDKGRYKHFGGHKGSSHHRAKLTDQDVRDIRSRRGTISCSALGSEYGLSKSQVSAIQTRRAWAHVN